MGVTPTLVNKEALLFDLADLWHGRATPALPPAQKTENMKVSVDLVKKKRRRGSSKVAGMKERCRIMKGNCARFCFL